MSYFGYILAGLALAVFSEKIDELTGHQRWVRKALSALAPLLIFIGFAQASISVIFR